MKLYTVAVLDEHLGEAFVYLRTLDELKAIELREHLHSVSSEYNDVQVIENELNEAVYLIDVKFKGSATIMNNVVEVGEPEHDEALKEAIVFKKTRIA